jgi:hypothetical protein
LNDEDLEDELAALDAIIFEEQMPAASVEHIAKKNESSNLKNDE